MSDKVIGQIFDRLNHSPVYKGFEYSFQFVFEGDFHTDIFYAAIDNNDNVIEFDVDVSYVAPSTTVTFTLSSMKSDLLMPGKLNWSATQDNGILITPITAGYIEVKKL